MLEFLEELSHLILSLRSRISLREYLLVQLLIHLREDTLESREATSERSRVEFEVDFRDNETGRFTLHSIVSAQYP